MRSLTREELESRKAQAVQFTRDVLGDPERAHEIEAESLEDYGERRKVTLINSSKRRTAFMARSKTNADLEAQIADLQEENQDLQDQLDAIADIVAPTDEDEDEDDEPDSDDDSADDDDDEGDSGSD
jgi:hypothetical protein